MATRCAVLARTCLCLAPLSATFATAQSIECQLQIGNPEVFQIAQLQGDSQRQALRALLAKSKPNLTLSEAVFHFGDKLRPALRELLQDPQVGDDAAGMLTFIGVPEDLRAIINSPPQLKEKPFGNRWASGVMAALFEPTSDEEWSFLERGAFGEFHDPWVDAGAIRALKLIASPRSRAILEESRRRNPNRARSLTQALEYVDSQPVLLSGTNLRTLAENIARAVKLGNWKGNSPVRCDEMGHRALVDFTFESGVDRFTFTANFHKSNGVWKLRGLGETMQSLIASPVPVSKGKL